MKGKNSKTQRNTEGDEASEKTEAEQSTDDLNITAKGRKAKKKGVSNASRISITQNQSSSTSISLPKPNLNHNIFESLDDSIDEDNDENDEIDFMRNHFSHFTENHPPSNSGHNSKIAILGN